MIRRQPDRTLLAAFVALLIWTTLALAGGWGLGIAMAARGGP